LLLASWLVLFDDVLLVVVFHEATIMSRASLNILGGSMCSGYTAICLLLGGSLGFVEVVLLTAWKFLQHFKD
jgi:hypothetical protein